MKKLDSFTLKIIAIITMLLDHVYTYITSTGINIPIWFGYLGKLAAPIFFYLIVEGFYHTRNRKKYLYRLAIFGVVMIGIDAVIGIHNNIFLSLTLSILMLMIMDYARDKEHKNMRIPAAISVLLIGALYMFTEASIYGFAMTLIFYFFREKKFLMAVVYIFFSLIPVFNMIGQPDIYEQLFLYDYQWMMVFSIILILMYNGKLGVKNNFTKWMFYVFYPMHLIAIVLISKII